MIQLLVKITIDDNPEAPTLKISVGEENSTASEAEKEVFQMFKDAIDTTAYAIRDAMGRLDKQVGVKKDDSE